MMQYKIQKTLYGKTAFHYIKNGCVSFARDGTAHVWVPAGHHNLMCTTCLSDDDELVIMNDPYNVWYLEMSTQALKLYKILEKEAEKLNGE